MVIDAEEYWLLDSNTRSEIPHTHSPSGPTRWPHAPDCVLGCGVDGSGRTQAMLVNTSQVPRPFRVAVAATTYTPARVPLIPPPTCRINHPLLYSGSTTLRYHSFNPSFTTSRHHTYDAQPVFPPTFWMEIPRRS